MKKDFNIHEWQAKYLREDSSRKQTAIDWLEERLTLSFGDEIKPLRGFFVIAKEMEKKQIFKALEEFVDITLPEEAKEEYYNERYK